MKNSAVRDWGLRLLVFAVVVGLWEVFVGYSQNFLLPRFTEIASGLFHLLFRDHRFWEALYISNQALLLGYAVSLLVGIPLGLPLDGYGGWIEFLTLMSVFFWRCRLRRSSRLSSSP